MKILDINHVVPSSDAYPFWACNMNVLGDAMPDVYSHEHQWHRTCIEWRIAEYAMDAEDIDSVLHLILHEQLIPGRTEVTCYTPGYDQAGALAWRLAHIQEKIDFHTARMTNEHARLAIPSIHGHPKLNPVRERGANPERLAAARLHVSGSRLIIHNGDRKNGVAKLREARIMIEGLKG
jgi:hypothetical protein